MSQGGYIPYHLRTNKAIERQIFVDTLKKIHTYKSIFDHIYIGFGGPFLEDFKLLHNEFDFQTMVSLEEDENVVKRQQFNKPYSCIVCKHENSKSFIADYQNNLNGRNSIFWLDYTRPSHFSQQLNEVVDLLGKMKEFDILRVTFNANPGSLVENKNLPTPELLEKRMEKFKERTGGYYLESQINSNMMTQKEFPGAINIITKYAIELAMQSGHVFIPLTSFSYADGQQMYTLTGIVLPKGEEASFLDTTKLSQWNFYNDFWQKPLSISTPPLSLKEKHTIDTELPFLHPTQEQLSAIEEKLGFQFSEAEMLASYIKYYRQFPQFSKIAM